MGVSNAGQTAVLLWSLLFGAGLGASFDLFRIRRFFSPAHPVEIFFQDLLWFLFAAVASFLFLFEVNDGTVRLFILLAFLVGGVFWRITFGRLVMGLCSRLKNFFIRRSELRAARKRDSAPSDEPERASHGDAHLGRTDAHGIVRKHTRHIT